MSLYMGALVASRHNPLLKSRIAERYGQKRIDAAQRLWRGFDAQDKAARTAQALAGLLERAKRLEAGLPPEYAQQIAAYNQAQYEKRRVALPK